MDLETEKEERVEAEGNLASVREQLIAATAQLENDLVKFKRKVSVKKTGEKALLKLWRLQELIVANGELKKANLTISSLEHSLRTSSAEVQAYVAIFSQTEDKFNQLKEDFSDHALARERLMGVQNRGLLKSIATSKRENLELLEKNSKLMEKKSTLQNSIASLESKVAEQSERLAKVTQASNWEYKRRETQGSIERRRRCQQAQSYRKRAQSCQKRTGSSTRERKGQMSRPLL